MGGCYDFWEKENSGMLQNNCSEDTNENSWEKVENAAHSGGTGGSKLENAAHSDGSGGAKLENAAHLGGPGGAKLSCDGYSLHFGAENLYSFECSLCYSRYFGYCLGRTE